MIAKGIVSGHRASVTLRRLIAMLIGLAMALTPLGMPAAATPTASHHDMIAMDKGSMGHCDGNTQPDQPKKSADKSCCAATCIGLAIAPALAGLPGEYAALALHATVGHFLDGVPAELPTPPPRSA